MHALATAIVTFAYIFILRSQILTLILLYPNIKENNSFYCRDSKSQNYAAKFACSLTYHIRHDETDNNKCYCFDW